MASQRVTGVMLLLLMIAGILGPGYSIGVVSSESATLVNPYDFDVFVEVDGVVYVVGSESKVNVPGGSTVCLTSRSESVYTGLDRRYVFAGWVIEGQLVSTEECITVPEDSTVRLYFAEEYRVTVSSRPIGLYYSSLWAFSGSNVTIEVPERIEQGSLIYRFTGWSHEALPPEANITIVVSSPIQLTAVYKPYYPVYVITNTSQGPILIGYVQSGGKILVSSLPLQEEVRISDDTRLVIDHIIVNNVSTKYDPLESIEVEGPTYIEPVYRLEYRVIVETAVRSIQAWMPPNSMFDVKTDSIVEVNESVRLVFTGWEGINASTPATTIIVQGPVHAKALYKTQYRVTIRSPLGMNSLWADAGSLVPVTLPDRLPGVIYDRVLSHYIVNSKAVAPGEGGVVFIPVEGPLDITAVYVVQLNWYHLGVALAFVLALIAIYLAYDVYTRGGRGEEEEEESS